VEFRVLGPLEVRAGSRVLDLGSRRQQRILAALLLNANRVVPVARLIEAAWDDDPPATANRQVRNRVAALRSVLTRRGGIIDTESSGYLVRVGPDELDATVFDRLVDRGRAAADPALLRQALALWRGRPLAGLGSRLLDADVATLEERRLAALEECIDLELAAGRAAELLTELTELVDRYPLRQRLVGQLMRALHRCGRGAQAKRAYDRLAGELADKLGIDPGADLRALAEMVSGGDALAATPRQLPADVSGFTGRSADLRWLDEVLSDHQSQRVVVVSAIAGTAGVGKTAFAVRWAHRVREQFPDGQLYINLRGYSSGRPVRPIDVLGGFLRAFGVAPEAIPTEPEAAAALYRDMLAKKRVLVVLDNAADVDQIRPLLPGTADSLAIVTSRDRLTGLTDGGTRRLTLDMLDADEAYALLAHLLGDGRVAAEPEATGEVARLCGNLPLALRIAAANLRDAENIAEYAGRLAAGNRLGNLIVDGDRSAAVRTAFDPSYAALPAAARRMFRLLGLVPGPHVAVEAAAALAGTTAPDARCQLDRLTSAHLLDEYEPGRYTFHDLIRLYAAEHARAEDEDCPGDPLGRLCDYYVHTARTAAEVAFPRMLHIDPLPVGPHASTGPAFSDQSAALAWFDAERPNLVATTLHAATHGPPEVAWSLADALRGYLGRRVHFADGLEVMQAGLRAAEAAGELNPQVVIHFALAHMYRSKGGYPQAIEHATRMLEISRRSRWLYAETSALGFLGTVYWMSGLPRQAVDHLARSLALTPSHDAVRQLSASGNLGAVHRELGHLAEAAELLTRSVDGYASVGSRGGEADGRYNLGEVLRDLGRTDDALDQLTRALNLYEELGDRSGQSDARQLLARVHGDRGEHDRALRLADEALDMSRETQWARHEANALNVLAGLHEARGDHELAVRRAEQAVRLARASGDRYPELDAMIGVASGHRGLGRHDTALEWAGQVLTVAVDSGYRLLEARARNVIAEIHLARGSLPQAIEQAERALAISRETGYQPGTDRALALLMAGDRV
jgi:DNA-binding SARP family transcriptional activator